MTFAWALFLVVTVASFIVQKSLHNRIEKYSRIRSHTGMTGCEAAERMLRDYGISGVSVTSTQGTLTDHYNPADMTVNLSEGVYNQNSIAAIAIAAHECGHAVQHDAAYKPLKMRSALVPVVNFASTWVSWVLLGGMFLIDIFPALLVFGIILFATTTLFSFVTLPVEVDASRRAIRWLIASNVCDSEELPAAKDALHAAAYTYVIAAFGSLATLLYYVLMLWSNDD